MRGDLDWIVMKALEKDRTRRYETANAMAMDVQRYLTNEPIVARPPSTIYKFKKLVRRNKTIFATVSVGMAALIIGLILSLYLFVQEKSALKRAIAAEQSERQLREQAERGVVSSRQIAQAGLLLMSGKYDESEKILQDIPPHETLVPFYNVFGGVHARRGEWLEALTNWNYVVKYAPDDHFGYMYLAPLLLQLDDMDDYKNLRTQILQKFGNITDPRVAERMVKASLLLPATADEMITISKMADVAGSVSTNSNNWSYNYFAKGLAEYRLGNYADATDLLQEILPQDIGSRVRTEAYFVLAMAQFRLNQSDVSRESFSNAVEVVNQLPKIVYPDDDWNEWITIHVLMREAVALNPDFSKAIAAAQPVVPKIEIPAWQIALTNAGWKFKSEKQNDGTWEVDLDDQPIMDVSMLHGASISRLTLMHTQVSDLAPLHGLSLTWLRLAGTKVSDLCPLQGMPLESLQISGTPVSDLTPLLGMPLKTLIMTSCTEITNLTPIEGITTLRSVILPPNAKNFEFLRGMTNLARISFKYDPSTKGSAQSAADFWKEFDQSKTVQP